MALNKIKFEEPKLTVPDNRVHVLTVPPEILTAESRSTAILHTEQKPDVPAEDHLARQIVELIETQDLSPGAAVETLGLPAEVMNRSVRDRIKVLLSENYVPADTQRATVRAARVKILLETLDSGLIKSANGELGLGALKVAAEMLKQIGSDPEVGLNQPPQQLVNIDIRGLAGVLAGLEPLPGFDKKDETNA